MPDELKGVAVNAVLVVFLVAATYTDWRFGKIYNALTFPVIVLGFLLNGCFNGIDGLQSSALGLMVGAGMLIVPFWLGGVGAGDVKFCAAVGALKGSPLAFWESFPMWAFLYGAALGGVFAAISLIRRRLGLSSLHQLMSYIFMRIVLRAPVEYVPAAPEAKMPYAVSLALGCLIALGLEVARGRAYPI